MKYKKIIPLGLTLVLALAACEKDEKNLEAPIAKTPGIIIENMDTSVKPSEDFYRFVNGNWDNNTKIPEDRTSWGSFAELRKNTDKDMLSILGDAIKNKDYKKNSDQEKAVHYYESILNIEARNKQGIEPIKPYLAEIEKIQTKKDVEAYITSNSKKGLGNGLFEFYIYNDMKNSTTNSVYLSGGSMGLSRDYYIDKDADTKDKLKKYEGFVATLLQKFGSDETTAKKDATTIVEFETKIAKVLMSKEERRDARKRYNPMSIKEIKKLSPEFDWAAYFKNVGIVGVDKIIVSDVNYIKELSSIYEKASISEIKTFFKWKTINASASKLTEELEKLNWEFYSQTLQGTKKQRPREERALNIVNGSIGEALGQLYVDKKFPPEAKKKAQEMIANVRLGFEKRINQVSWMSDKTKKKAIEKLNKLTVKVAYPDKWKDYSELEIKSVENGGSFFQNNINLSKWDFEKMMKKLGKPVDKSEWGMSPQTVNAYFNSSNNEIVFPAAILQPPFYNYQADEAVNYGGIGAVIGHEISHSFDDSGARFDGDGNLNNWWTKKDAAAFKVAGERLIKQFSDVEVLKDVHVNGKFTLGENIGDLGGVLSSYEGFKIFLAKNGTPDKIDGFTAEQRFFMSWATVWRTKLRDDALKNKIKTDPHSPGFLRAYMPLQNVDAFYQAFDIKEGDKMYLKPEDRVRIW